MPDEIALNAEKYSFERTAGFLLIGLLTVAAAVNFSSVYPVFMDVNYHMAAVEGFAQAGGIPAVDFWDAAPYGRPHLYAPFTHVVGYLMVLIGIPPWMSITIISFVCYPLSLLLVFLLIKRIGGARAALVSAALLAGPQAWFFNQSAHTANAVALVLGLASFNFYFAGRFAAAGVFAALAPLAHGSGYAVPAAYLLYLLAARKNVRQTALILAFSIAAAAPFMLHAYANRNFETERTPFSTGFWQIGDFKFFALHMPLALAGLILAFFRRRTALFLPCFLASFFVMFPFHYAHRFWLFNSLLPYSMLAGISVVALAEWMERKLPKVSASAVTVVFAAAGLLFMPVIELGFGKEPPNRPKIEARSKGAQNIYDIAGKKTGRRAPDNRPPGMSPGPGGPVEPAGPGGPAGPPPDRGIIRFEQLAVTAFTGAMPDGRNPLHSKDAWESLDALKKHLKPGDVVDTPDFAAANLITGVTGAWSTRGMLAEIGGYKISETNPRMPVGSEYVGFILIPKQRQGQMPAFAPRRLSPDGADTDAPPRKVPGFDLAEDTPQFTLYKRNAAPTPVELKPESVIPLWMILVSVLACAALVLLDFSVINPAPKIREILFAAIPVVAIACLIPMAVYAAGECSVDLKPEKIKTSPPPWAPRGPGGGPGMDRPGSPFPPDMAEGGPPPGMDGFNAPPDRRPRPASNVPPQLVERARRIFRTAQEMIQNGELPDYFLPPEANERMREMLEDGDVDGLRKEVERAENLLNSGGREDEPPPAPKSSGKF
jgi:hypothetical protein